MPKPIDIPLHAFKVHFSESTYNRGAAYVNLDKVLKLNVVDYDDKTIEIFAQTEGSHRKTYTQEILVECFENKIAIEGDCSCPVGFNCKHVVAVCLTYGQVTKEGLQGDVSSSGSIPEHIQHWLNEMHHSQVVSAPSASGERDYLVYLLDLEPNVRGAETEQVTVKIRSTRPRKSGQGMIKGVEVDPHHVSQPYAIFHAQPIDLDIASLIKGSVQSRWWYKPSLTGRVGALCLSMMLQTGRCFWQEVESPPLKEGGTRGLDIEWIEQRKGALKLECRSQGGGLVLSTNPPMYIDTKTYAVGHLDTQSWSVEQIEHLKKSPVIPPRVAKELTTTLMQRFPSIPLPYPTKINILENAVCQAVPHLTLSQFSQEEQVMHCLKMVFIYANNSVCAFPHQAHSFQQQDDTWLKILRNTEQEKRYVEEIQNLGFAYLTNHASASLFLAQENDFKNDAEVWAEFLTHLDRLRSDGWKVDIAEDFQLKFEHAELETWVEEGKEENAGMNDWFSLRFDLMLQGNSVPLAPLIAPFLERGSENLPEILTLPWKEHHYIRIESDKVRPTIEVLFELFGHTSINEAGDIKLARYDLTALQQLERDAVAVQGSQHLIRLAHQLENFSEITKVAIPDALNAKLRPYQHIGVSWLQFLREYQFNGILADDMGLGKTIQTLTHILIEKEQGRLKNPVLVVAPTSLMGNWRREIETFTPDLRLTVLHGIGRHQHWEHIKQNDILVTTYSLLTRDIDILMKFEFHSVVLDEAQAIKNPATKVSSIVRKLKCKSRLCLTGTPLENHLGELWAQFDFLMPGFLGTQKLFKTHFRNPIENNGDVILGGQLAKRIQPFLLRRNKLEVEKELPKKSEILKTVSLGEAQAGLYESIRIAMDDRVKKAIASQGLARSHITILDALLKLRQTCCDPRLLKLKQAEQIKYSAKLELLMQMIPELLDEGRRILLFSQFTSMLGLIETELEKHKISYSKLTGQTRNREQVINQFKKGEVALFLISLKAGGVGLNLTEADTVIIYDPWWNPAVEAQAIDRAHRIGQSKPVFVYKLVVENSVEEKMLQMQQKKSELAKGVYSEKSQNRSTPFDKENIKALFQPLVE